jgi:hypothetical protein
MSGFVVGLRANLNALLEGRGLRVASKGEVGRFFAVEWKEDVVVVWVTTLEGWVW